MKVLQINAVYGVASTGRIVEEIDKKLKEENIESVVATTKTSIDNSELYIIGNKLDWKLHGLLSRIFGKQGYFSIMATRKLLKYIKKENFDIVHLHNLHANYINMPMLLKFLEKNNIATVITLHDCFFLTGKCTHYIDVPCYKWIDGCKKCPKLKADNPSWFFDRTYKIWNDKKKYFNRIPRLAVIGVSDWIVNEAKKSILKDAKIIKRIYNWIDLDIFCPRSSDVKKKYNIPEDKFIICLVSAGWRENSRRYNNFIKLSKLISDSMHIVIVGGGLENISLPSNITKIGYINSQDELAKLYSMADVYVHLSEADTFGTVVAEAMSCGTPAIVFDRTALPELIKDNCGYVVRCGDINELYEKIKTVENNGKSYYSEYLANFSKKFKKEYLLNKTINIYKSISK